MIDLGSISIEDLWAYNKSNEEIFDQLSSNIERIIPFVGAGMSALSGEVFPLWEAFLRKIYEKCEVTEEYYVFAHSKTFERVATDIAKLRGTAIWKNDLRSSFAHKPQYTDYVDKAVYVIPLLFPSLVVTTNFDSLLEIVYSHHNVSFHSNIGHPGHFEILKRGMVLQKEPALYKFHGDINDLSTLVLTEEEYAGAYDNGKIVEELREVFTGSCLLFLGCSLQEDRTMAVLRSTLDRQHLSHFTFYPASKSDMSQISLRLSNDGILPIFYPEGHHEAVRIYLEELLRRKNAERYYNLPIKHLEENRSRVVTGSRKYLYDTNIVSFFGREKEFQMLYDFCELKTNSPVKWLCITGPGGMGKSRLAYEFSQRLDREYWDIRQPSSYSIDGLRKCSDNIIRNTLIIVDYAARFPQEIGVWIEELYRNHSFPIIRIIMLDRSSNEESWLLSQMKKAVASLGSLQYTRSDFIELQGLEKHSLIKIVESYSSSQQIDIPVAKVNEFIEHLCVIDPEKPRPLFILFMVDAYADNLNPLKWDVQDMLEYVINRESKYIESSLEVKNALSDCLYLKAVATMLGKLKISDMKGYCPKEWEYLYNEINASNLEKTLSFLRLSTVLEDYGTNAFIAPLLPDIVGEYYTLKTFASIVKDNEDKIGILLLNGWVNKSRYVAEYWERTIKDFIEIILHDNSFKRMLKILIIINFDYFDKISINNYAYLNNILYKETLKEVFLHPLEKIYESEKANSVATSLYTNALSVHAAFQTSAESIDIVSLIENIANCYTTKDDTTYPFILGDLAQGYYNLTVKLAIDEAKNYVHKIKDIHQQNKLHEGVAELYARSLYNVTGRGSDTPTRFWACNELYELLSLYPSNTTILNHLAKCMFHYSQPLDNDDRIKLVEPFKSLLSSHEPTSEVLENCMALLHNISCSKNPEQILFAVNNMFEIYENSDRKAEIVDRIKKSTLNLTYYSNEQLSERAVIILKQIFQQFPDAVYEEYLNALTNHLCDIRGTSKVSEILLEQENIYRVYKEVGNLNKYMLAALVTAMNNQEASEQEKLLYRIEDILQSNPDDIEDNSYYAAALYNYSNHQDINHAEITISKIKEIAKKYPCKATFEPLEKAKHNLAIKKRSHS